MKQLFKEDNKKLLQYMWKFMDNHSAYIFSTDYFGEELEEKDFRNSLHIIVEDVNPWDRESVRKKLEESDDNFVRIFCDLLLQMSYEDIIDIAYAASYYGNKDKFIEIYCDKYKDDIE